MALPPFNAVVSSASIVFPQRSTAPKYDAWQSTAWGFWENVDEFFFGVQWLSHMLSRIRLLIAEVAPGGDEPSPVDEGPAADLLARLAGGTGGQTQLLGDATVHLSVAGEFWLVGETNPVTGVEAWSIRSADELRVSRRKGTDWEVREGDADRAWRALTPDSLVVRAWSPHKRWAWRADSPARHALGALTSLDIINKRMLATDLSRLASNGILLYDRARLSVPARSSPAEADVDPFASMLVAIASRGIADPTSPEATIPIPIGYDIDDLTGVDPKALMQVIRMDNGVDAELLAHRDSAVKRLAIAMDLPAEILLGLGDSNHWCVDTETEILTADRGWVREPDLVVGDEVRTLDHVSGLAYWSPVEYIYRADVVDEPMRALESVTHSSLTTLNHRWPVLSQQGKGAVTKNRRRAWTTTDTLSRQDRILVSAPSGDLPTEAKYSDALVEIMAWVWTEGCVRPTNLSISQSHTRNPGRVASIRAALTAMYGPATGTSMRGIGRPAWREVVQEVACETSFGGPTTSFRLNQEAALPLRDLGGKRPTPDFIRSLTRAQLELFIEMSCQGDGWHYRQGVTDIWQRVDRDLDAFDLACVLAGRCVIRGTATQTPDSIPGYYVLASNREITRPVDTAARATGTATDTLVPYTGMVWCPTTRHGTWLARRHGKTYWTGNSSWMLEESAIKTHVSPLAELICRCLTTGYLLPALTAAGEDLTGPDGGQLLVWYDPSEITARPDRSANVVQAYDRLECSGTALRRELGVDEADAPNAVELAAMVVKMAVKVPALSASAIESLGGPKLVADFGGAGGAPAISLPGDPANPGARTGPPVPATSNGSGP